MECGADGAEDAGGRGVHVDDSVVEVVYQESDGTPLGETEAHVEATLDLLQSFKWFFRDRPEVYAAANMFLYYEEGNPRARVCPDVYVAVGVASRRHRRTYKVWEEGAPPFLAVEVTSRSTRREDLGKKRSVYQAIGVSEYVLFDPLDEYLKPRFQAFRRVGNELVRVLPTATGLHAIPSLGLALAPRDDRLDVVDLATGKTTPRLVEATVRAERESVRAEQESARAEQESARAEQESARADRERRRRQELEAEVARLREELDRRG